MPSFRHKRTGRVADVAPGDAFRFNNDRWEPVETEASLVVPSGTVAEILAWAGDDSTRRAAALTVEKAGKNRKSLIEALS